MRKPLPAPRTPGSRQSGAALAVSLILLTVATMVGVTSISSTQTGERIAANQKQATDAFMAAEAGMSHVLKQLRDGTLQLNELSNPFTGTMNESVRWSVQLAGPKTLQSEGTVSSGDEVLTSRTILMNLKQAGKLAPFNIIGRIGGTFNPANSNKFKVIGEQGADGETLGPAIATNRLTDADMQLFEQAMADDNVSTADTDFCDWLLAESERNQDIDDVSARTPIPNVYRIECEIRAVDRLDNYDGGIREIDFDAPFGDPAELIKFIRAIEARYCDNPDLRGLTPGQTGYECAPSTEGQSEIVALASTEDSNGADMGCVTTDDSECEPKITIWDAEVEGSDLTLGGNDSGAGILLVKGNLEFSGTPSFDGLVIVTGQRFSISGGGQGGVLGGSVVFANPQQVTTESGEEKWAFDDAEANFNFDFEVDGGGSATFQHDDEALDRARNLLGNDSGFSWTPQSPSFEMSNWREVW